MKWLKTTKIQKPLSTSGSNTSYVSLQQLMVLQHHSALASHHKSPQRMFYCFIIQHYYF